MKKNLLLRKIGYDVATWEANNCNVYMADISRTKGNQTVKFGQLIEHNMRNIFLEKQYTKCGGETSPKPFFKNIKIKLQTACF